MEVVVLFGNGDMGIDDRTFPVTTAPKTADAAKGKRPLPACACGVIRLAVDKVLENDAAGLQAR